MRQRPPRVTIPGANLRFANTAAELVNVSQTGALIRLAFKPRVGGEWPLSLDLPTRRQVWLNGRVVRCQQDPSGRGPAPQASDYLLGLAFVQPSETAQEVLVQLCGVSTTKPLDTDSTPRRRPSRLRRFCLSLQRQCPECSSTAVTKEAGHHYRCKQCGCDFTGFHLGLVRIAL